MDDMCGQPYAHNGDIRSCRLPLWHDETCEEANHQAFIASLKARGDIHRWWVF